MDGSSMIFCSNSLQGKDFVSMAPPPQFVLDDSRRDWNIIQYSEWTLLDMSLETPFYTIQVGASLRDCP